MKLTCQKDLTDMVLFIFQTIFFRNCVTLSTYD